MDLAIDFNRAQVFAENFDVFFNQTYHVFHEFLEI